MRKFAAVPVLRQDPHRIDAICAHKSHVTSACVYIIPVASPQLVCVCAEDIQLPVQASLDLCF